jgi:hypothetical protein
MHAPSVYMMVRLIMFLISALVDLQLPCTASTEEADHGLEPSLLRCDAQMSVCRQHVVRSAKTTLNLALRQLNNFISSKVYFGFSVKPYAYCVHGIAPLGIVRSSRALPLATRSGSLCTRLVQWVIGWMEAFSQIRSSRTPLSS